MQCLKWVDLNSIGHAGCFIVWKGSEGEWKLGYSHEIITWKLGREGKYIVKLMYGVTTVFDNCYSAEGIICMN